MFVFGVFYQNMKWLAKLGILINLKSIVIIMKKLLLLSGLCLSACMMNAQTIVDSQAELEKLFVEAPFNFSDPLEMLGLPTD